MEFGEPLKFRMVSDTLRWNIIHALMEPGEKFLTRSEICQQFGISPMTAVKVQRVLLNEGLIVPTARKGFAVAKELPSYHVPLKRVRMLGHSNAIGDERPMGSAIVRGLREECARNGLEFVREFTDRKDGAMQPHRGLTIAPDEGLALFMHTDLLPYVIQPLMDERVRAVTIDGLFPNRSAVLQDNLNGMKTIVAYLKKRHVHKILFADCLGYTNDSFYRSERYEHLKFFATAEGMSVECLQVHSLKELADKVCREHVDALVFTNDPEAIIFRQQYPDLGIVVGFGDCVNYPDSEKHFNMATIHIDAAEMGRRAIRLLLYPTTPFFSPHYEWVGGGIVEYK